MKTYYENILPHVQPPGAAFHVVFRLFDSIPQKVLNDIKDELELEKTKYLTSKNRNFNSETQKLKQLQLDKFELQLDAGKYGKCFLRKKQVAQILADKIESYNSKYYDLVAFCIMPNHVHLLIDLNVQLVKNDRKDYVPLYKIMQLIKGGSSFLINKNLGRTGKLWKRESFDRWIRNEKELVNTIEYIRQNPKKVDLPSQFSEWPFMYIHPDYKD